MESSTTNFYDVRNIHVAVDGKGKMRIFGVRILLLVVRQVFLRNTSKPICFQTQNSFPSSEDSIQKLYMLPGAQKTG